MIKIIIRLRVIVIGYFAWPKPLSRDEASSFVEVALVYGEGEGLNKNRRRA